MSAVLNIPIHDEFLTHEEMIELTGCRYTKDQIAWLQNNGWAFSKAKSGRPIVSRWAMRLRLAGVPVQNKPVNQYVPDFSKAQ